MRLVHKIYLVALVVVAGLFLYANYPVTRNTLEWLFIANNTFWTFYFLAK